VVWTSLQSTTPSLYSPNATTQLIALTNLNSTDNATSLDNNATLDTSIGTSWTTLYDLTQTVMLSTGFDGNIYLAGYTNTSDNPQTSVLFDSDAGIVTSDYASRLFVYFPNSMALYNASRLRLVEDPYIPFGSQVITLTPFAMGSSSVYVPMDTAGDAFQLARYTYADGSTPKVFVVSDPNSGPANLQLPELRWTITGGIVGNCSTLSITSEGESGYDVGAS
jgi:hypothetical protein